MEIESGDDSIKLDVWKNAFSFPISEEEQDIESELNEKLGFKKVEVSWLVTKFTDMNGDSLEQKECEEFNIMG